MRKTFQLSILVYVRTQVRALASKARALKVRGSGMSLRIALGMLRLESLLWLGLGSCHTHPHAVVALMCLRPPTPPNHIQRPTTWCIPHTYRHMPGIQMNGRAIVRWARFLSGKYADAVDGACLNTAALHAYERVNGVPDSMVDAAVTASTEEEARALTQVGRRGIHKFRRHALRSIFAKPCNGSLPL